MERDTGRHRIDERAGRVLLHPRPADDAERPVRELLGLDPCPSSDRDRGTLAQRHCHRVGRCPARGPPRRRRRSRSSAWSISPASHVRDREQQPWRSAGTGSRGRVSRPRAPRLRASSRPLADIAAHAGGPATSRSKRCRRAACRRSSRVRRHRPSAPPPPAGPRARRAVAPSTATAAFVSSAPCASSHSSQRSTVVTRPLW